MEPAQNQEKEVLIIDVEVNDVYDISDGDEYICMIHFSGNCDCPNFKGQILPGGVDTQTKRIGQCHTLSARYILEGTDCNQQPCRIYIENNGVEEIEGEPMVTHPSVFTNSKALKWMETASLYGRIFPRRDRVLIKIYCENNPNVKNIDKENRFS